MSKGSAIVGFLLCFFAGMALMWSVDKYGSHSTVDATKESGAAIGGLDHSAAKVPVTKADPSWGNADAPVTVVMYSDYECPYCSRVEPTIHKLKAKYGKSKLRVVWKHFPLPFHKKAVPAHVAAATVFKVAGNDAFWKFHEMVFKNQKNLNPQNFNKWAAQAGVNMGKFKAELAKNSMKAKVDDDLKTGKAAGVSGTPASFINGVFLSGAQPYNAFETEIEKQLKAANQAIAAGTPKSKIYVTMTNRNHKGKAKRAKKKPKERPGQDSKTVWKVPVSKNDPQKGNPNALVTIVEFSEYQCPFCARVLPTIKQIMDTYKDKVRFVWKDNPLPFHKRALPASMLAREAQAQKGAKGFWAAHDLLFANQKKLEDEDLWGYAKQLGLNEAKVKEAVAKSKYKAAADAAQELASDLNASGTPHFFINGRRIVGAQPFSKFKEIIDQEITKSQAMLKKGIKAADLYAEIMKTGKAPPPPEKKDVGPAPADAPYKGGATAKVVIQEFSDFQCPYCSRVNGTLKQIEKTYGNKVKIVWRHKPLPFHKEAPLAHQAAHEAFVQKGNKGFWAMHDKLFANQKQLKREHLDKYAAELQLDVAKFKKSLDNQTHKARVDKDNQASAKGGIGGTPAFVINGYFLSGAQPFAKFKKLIDRALKEAK